jgi:hypothetical protein
MHFVFMYENRTMKPVAIFLGRRVGEIREKDGEGESS